MVIVNRTGDFISGALNGKQFGVSYDEQKYAIMKELEAKAAIATTVEELKAIIAEFEPLTKESYKELVETATPYLFVNRHTNKFYLKYKDTLSSKAIPQALVDRMLTSVEKNIDINPLVKCWVRFLRNPNFTDRKASLFAEYISAPYTDTSRAAELMKKEGVGTEYATQLATTTQVAISLEGLLVGYKVSREILTRYDLNDDEEVVTKSRYKKTVDPDTGVITYDSPEFAEDLLFEPAVMGQRGDEFWCVGQDSAGVSISKKGHHIRVGALHYLENWNQVDCGDHHSGAPGLHVGGLKYISGFQNGDGMITHNVLIDPADIGAIVGLGYGHDGAMRVRRYFVHSSFAGPNRNIYHSSKYAAMNDTEYKSSLEEVVKKTQMMKKEADEMLDEQMALA